MDATARKPYPSDVTDAQWELMQIVIPDAKPGGRPRSVDMREVINAMLYVNRSGCQWDMLPHDLPAKSTVYEYFAAWRDDGTWQARLDVLREACPHFGVMSARGQEGYGALTKMCFLGPFAGRCNAGSGWPARTCVTLATLSRVLHQDFTRRERNWSGCRAYIG